MALVLEAEALSDAWVEEFAAAIGPGVPAGSAEPVTVAFTIGKTKRAVLTIAGGAVIVGQDAPSVAEEDVAVTVPFTGAQLAAMVAGEESMAEAYIRGDLKPVGAIGAFLPVVELFESLT